MTGLTIPRPQADEAASFYHGYIAKVTGDNIVDQLTRQLGEVEQLYGRVDDARGNESYAPGKWSAKEVLGHIADAERIFSYRLLRIGRGDRTPLAGFDENAYVPPARFNARTVRSLLEDFRSVRQSTLALIQGLPPQAWSERGTASDNEVSARALAYIMVGHVSHHVGVLRERYGLGRSQTAVR